MNTEIKQRERKSTATAIESFDTIAETNTKPIAVRSLEITPEDGVPLSGRVYARETGSDLTALMLPGIGVPQRAFRHLARWLAEHGVRCVTVDYRGIGQSATDKGIDSASLSAWAGKDAAAAMRYCENTWWEPVVLVGHSFGGQAVGLTAALNRVRAAVFVGSQLGTARYWDGAARWQLAMYWHLVLPVLARTFRELPRWTGPAGRLPRGVAAEWSRWGRSPHWFLSEIPGSGDRIGRFTAPVLAYAIEDDPIAPPRAVSAFLELFSATSPLRRNGGPREVGVEYLGHTGLLRPAEENRMIWWEILMFLRQAANGSNDVRQAS